MQKAKAVQSIRKGFSYQDHFGAWKLLELLLDSGPIRVTLESVEGAHVDDVVVEWPERIDYYQVKWTGDPATCYSFQSLIQKDTPTSTSLLGKFAKSWNQLRRKDKPFLLHLFSNKVAAPGNNDLAAVLLLDGRLKPEFFTDKRFQEIGEAWRKDTGLEVDEFAEFVHCLRFELGKYSDEEMRDRVVERMSQLGIELQLYERLMVGCIEWATTGREPLDKIAVLVYLGLADRLRDPLVHRFPVEEATFVDNPELTWELDERTDRFGSGYIVLLGPPGSGKSTFLSRYVKTRRQLTGSPVCEYYCFTSLSDPYQAERVAGQSFERSLTKFLRESYPGIFAGQKPYEVSYERLTEMLHSLSRQLEPGQGLAVFVIDGLDEVGRSGIERSESLFASLPSPFSLPKNIIFVVSAQAEEQLPSHLRQSFLGSDRFIMMNQFSSAQTGEYVRKCLARVLEGDASKQQSIAYPNNLSLLHHKSEGLPLYLRYIVDKWLSEQPVDFTSFIQSFPKIDGEISNYYAHIFCQVQLDATAGYLTALLATLTFPVTEQELAEIANEPSIDRFKAKDIVRSISHLLRWQDNRFSIFHSSFREFVAQQSSGNVSELNQKIYDYLRSHPESDQAAGFLFEYALRVGHFAFVIENCNRHYLQDRLEARRPFSEIQENLNRAIRAAGEARDLVPLVRMGLLNYLFNSFLYEIDQRRIQEALVAMDETEAAIRYSLFEGHLEGGIKEALELAFDLYLKNQKKESLALLEIAIAAIQATEHWGDVANLSAYCQAMTAHAVDIAGFWNWIQDLEWPGEKDTQTYRRSLTNLVLDTLVRLGKLDAIDALLSTEDDVLLKAYVVLARTRALRNQGNKELALRQMVELAKEVHSLGNKDLTISFCDFAVDCGLQPEVVRTTLGDIILSWPSYQHIDLLEDSEFDTFRKYVKILAYSDRNQEVEALDELLRQEETLIARYIRLQLLLGKVEAGAIDPRELLDTIAALFQSLGVSRRELGAGWDFHQDGFIRRNFGPFCCRILTLYRERFSDNLAGLTKTLRESIPERYWSLGTRKSVVRTLATVHNLHGDCIELVDRMEDEVDQSVLMACERSSEYLELAAIVAELGELERARLLFNKGLRAGLGHGSHKDMQLFELLLAAERLASIDPDDRFGRVANAADMVDWVDDVTDGDETGHLPNEVVQNLAKLDLVAAFRMTEQYERQKDSFDWDLSVREMAPMVATQDVELAWALLGLLTRGTQDDLDRQFKVRLKVIESILNVGQQEVALGLVKDMERFIKQEVQRSKHNDFFARLQRTVSPKGRKGVEAEPPVLDSDFQEEPIKIGKKKWSISQFGQQLTKSVENLEQIFGSLSRSDLWRIEKQVSWAICWHIDKAEDKGILDRIGALLTSRRYLHSEKVLLRLAERYRDLGDNDKFLELAREAHSGSYPWASRWYGADLTAFITIASADKTKAEDLLYESLAYSYIHSPWSGVSSIAQLIHALKALAMETKCKPIYQEFESHAYDLFSHLPPRASKYNWLRQWSPSASPDMFGQEILRFIVSRLAWPELAVREHALLSLLRLLDTRAQLTAEAVAEATKATNLAIASAAFAALHAASLRMPNTLIDQAALIADGLDSGHLNIIDSAKQTVLNLQGLIPEEVSAPLSRKAHSLLSPKPLATGLHHLALPAMPLTHQQLKRLQYWQPVWETMHTISDILGLDFAYVAYRTFKEMYSLGYDEVEVTSDKEKNWQRYSHPAFDQVIPFEDAHVYFLKHALSRVVAELIGPRNPSQAQIDLILPLMREYDPIFPNRFVTGRPQDIWLEGSTLTEQSWVSFQDRGDMIREREFEDSWFTIYEYRSLIEGERQEEIRRYAMLIDKTLNHSDLLRLVPPEFLPVISLVPDHRWKGLYREQAKKHMQIMPKFAKQVPGVRCLFALHIGRWRYCGPYEIAILLREFVEKYHLEWYDDFGLDMQRNGEIVLKFEEWKEGHSNSHYSREPLSFGARLVVKSSVISEICRDYGDKLARLEYAQRMRAPSIYAGEAREPRERWQIILFST